MKKKKKNGERGGGKAKGGGLLKGVGVFKKKPFKYLDAGGEPLGGGGDQREGEKKSHFFGPQKPCFLPGKENSGKKAPVFPLRFKKKKKKNPFLFYWERGRGFLEGGGDTCSQRLEEIFEFIFF